MATGVVVAAGVMRRRRTSFASPQPVMRGANFHQRVSGRVGAWSPHAKCAVQPCLLRRVGGGCLCPTHGSTSSNPTEESKTLPKADRLIETFGKKKHVKKLVTTFLVVTGVGGATLVSPLTHRDTAVTVEQPPAGDTVTKSAAAITPRPVVVTKDSGPQSIVKAIVSQGQAARLSEDQIKTVIATAKIESTLRPTAYGGVQAYGGPGAGADEVIGLFQEKASFGTVAERQDPNKAIARFIARFTEAFKKYRVGSDSVLAATLAQNPQLLRYNGGVGTQYYNTVKAAMSAAADLYSEAVGVTLQPVT